MSSHPIEIKLSDEILLILVKGIRTEMSVNSLRSVVDEIVKAADKHRTLNECGANGYESIRDFLHDTYPEVCEAASEAICQRGSQSQPQALIETIKRLANPEDY